MTAKSENTPRPLALVLPGDSGRIGESPARALREDLLEVLQFLRLRTATAEDAEGASDRAADHDGPVLVTFDDVPGLPMEIVEGAIEELDEAPVVIGPCADGSVYLLGLGDGLSGAACAALIGACARSLEDLVATLEELKLEGLALPPWFRLRSDKDVSFARALARLSTLSEEGDMDFLADRLKLWLSQGTDA